MSDLNSSEQILNFHEERIKGLEGSTKEISNNVAQLNVKVDVMSQQIKDTGTQISEKIDSTLNILSQKIDQTSSKVEKINGQVSDSSNRLSKIESKEATRVRNGLLMKKGLMGFTLTGAGAALGKLLEMWFK